MLEETLVFRDIPHPFIFILGQSSKDRVEAPHCHSGGLDAVVPACAATAAATIDACELHVAEAQTAALRLLCTQSIFEIFSELCK